MEEKDLRNIWKGSSDNAEHYYNEVQPELLKKAQKRSSDILTKVNRTMNTELVLSVIVAIIFPFAFYEYPVYFVLMVLLMAVALFLTLRLYLNYKKQIRSIAETVVTESLSQKIKILGAFTRRLYVYVYIIAPIAFFVGASFSIFTQGETEFARIAFILAFSLPFLGLFIWLMKKYVDILYKKQLMGLKEVLKGLENG